MEAKRGTKPSEVSCIVGNGDREVSSTKVAVAIVSMPHLAMKEIRVTFLVSLRVFRETTGGLLYAGSSNHAEKAIFCMVVGRASDATRGKYELWSRVERENPSCPGLRQN